MAEFNWVGKTRDGLVKKGVIAASDSEAAMAALRAQAIMPTSVKAKPKDLAEMIPALQPKITTKDIVIFTRQFATMIDAGLPLVQCLEILGSQQENTTFKKVIQQKPKHSDSSTTISLNQYMAELNLNKGQCMKCNL